MASGPGYAKRPEHRVSAATEPARLRVTLGGETLAESARAIALSESGYGVVHYFPKADVRMERLAPTAHSSYCPFKGVASYWSVGQLANVVWAYEAPYDEVAGIAGHLAFWFAKMPGARLERL